MAHRDEGWRPLSAYPAAMTSADDPQTYRPIVEATLNLRGMSDKPARDVIRRACREAQAGPVFIRRWDGAIIGAIVTEGQAREVAWREMARMGSERGEP